jgi:hypothetical protein
MAVKFMRRTAVCTRSDYKKNLRHNDESWNSWTGKKICSSDASLKTTVSNSPLPSKRTMIFVKTLLTLAGNCSRTEDLRRERLLLLMMMIVVVVVMSKYY